MIIRSERHIWSLAVGASLVLGFWILVLSCSSQEIAGEPDAVIRYQDSTNLNDPVALLQKRLAEGKTRLQFKPGRGYLQSLLKELRVPISSQGLVFSKTSSQAEQT